LRRGGEPGIARERRLEQAHRFAIVMKMRLGERLIVQRRRALRLGGFQSDGPPKLRDGGAPVPARFGR